jgi:hypothetical protein
MKLKVVLEDLHRDENDLARTLVEVAERHRADHELYHLGQDLATWSQDHVRHLAALAPAYGLELDPEPEGAPSGAHRVGRALREVAGQMAGRSPDAELLMLRDLRRIHLAATGVMLDWEMVAQAAQALRHEELKTLAETCLAQTKRQIAWANTKIKESSTQALVV